MKSFIEFLRRNLLVILALLLIVGQFLTWRTLVGLAANVDYYICGTATTPCRVIVVPPR